MIILAVIGAIGVVAAIWEELGPRIRREKTEDWDFDDDFEADDVRSAAAQLELEHTWWEMSLEALEAEPAFQLAVSALADADTDVAEVVTLSRDADGWVASMALAALAQREDVPDDWLTWAARNPVRPSVCEDRLLLRALAVHSGQPVIGAGLLALESLRDEVVAEFVGERISRGEQVDCRHVRQALARDGRQPRGVHRPIRSGPRTRLPPELRNLARTGEPQEHRADLGATVRRSAHAPGRSSTRARGDRRGRARTEPAAIRPPRRRARRGEDRTDTGSARSHRRRRDRLRDDRCADQRRRDLHR